MTFNLFAWLFSFFFGLQKDDPLSPLDPPVEPDVRATIDVNG